jgi:hypothetical protein
MDGPEVTREHFISTASWLSWRIEISPSAAREHVRVARAISPNRRSIRRGQHQLLQIPSNYPSRNPETEQDFLDIAMHATASQIERLTAAYRRTRIDPAQPNLNLRRFARRSDTASGMVRLEIQLPPEQASIVWEALSAALDAGRRDDRDSESASAEAPRPGPDPTVLQAERADALVSVAQAYLQHDEPRTLGSGYELVMLTTPEQLEHAPGGVGGFLRDGTPVPQHIARMLACDCSRVDVTTNESGEILDVGRARRTIPSAIGRALWLRDGGCRVPGCGRRHHLHAHHIESWATGGKTAASNLVLLCPSHHTLVHEGQLFVQVHSGKLEFRNAYGLKLHPNPAREEIGTWQPEVDARFPRWDGSPLDLEVVVNSIYAAHPSAHC